MAKNMSREQAIAHLRAGRSVGVNMPNGSRVHVTKIEDLPSEALMSQGDPDAAKTARENLIREQKRIEAELEILNGQTDKPARGSRAKAKAGDAATDAGTGTGTGEAAGEGEGDDDEGEGAGAGDGPPAQV